MIGCIVAAVILFAGLAMAWILFKPLSIMADLYDRLTADAVSPMADIVGLIIYGLPLVLFIWAFVMAYNYLRQRKQKKNRFMDIMGGQE